MAETWRSYGFEVVESVFNILLSYPGNETGKMNQVGLLLGLLAKIKMLGVLPAHLPLVLDAVTVLVSVPSLSCAGFVCGVVTAQRGSGVRQYTRLYSHCHCHSIKQ